MFPQFEKLDDDSAGANAVSLEHNGFHESAAAANTLTRLKNFWLIRQATSPTSKWPTSADSREPVPEWYWILERVLREAPLKDTVLIVVDQYVRNAFDQIDVFAFFEQTPRALDILARIACGSPFLTQILLADPLCLTTLTQHGRTAEMKSREQFVSEAMATVADYPDRHMRLTNLRWFQRRELLRIGICDAFGLLDLRFVTLQLSHLADAMVQSCLEIAAANVADLPGIDRSIIVVGDAASVGSDAGSIRHEGVRLRLAVISLGKHGGEELNYSSDIDLVLIADHDSSEVQRLARLLIDGLADNISPGFLYRVDLRLRPWGQAGPLVSTIPSYADYLIQDAALWEKQAMLKARVVAGDFEIGQQFLRTMQPLLFSASADQVRSGIHQMKERIEARLRQRGKLNAQVKLGVGSIRDVEFLVQSLQLIHGELEPRVLSCNTLDSLVRLAEFGLIDAAWYRQLRAGYVFLRTIEHSLQLLHNQQTHELPADQRQLEWLAHRLDYPDAATLMLRFNEHRRAVRAIFDQCLSGAAMLPPELSAGISEPDVPMSGTDDDVAANELQRANRFVLLQADFGRLDGGATAVIRCTRSLSKANLWELTICGKDFSGWLSAICGLLSIYRLDIRRGDALTGGGTNGFGDRCAAGRFLACFEVTLDSALLGVESEAQSIADELAVSLQAELTRLGDLSRNGRIDEARTELLTRFCDAVPRQTSGESSPADVDVELVRLPDSVLTQMNIRGADTWGFLYELASALSLSRFRVLRAIIGAEGSRVRDVLYVRERNGRPIDSDERLQELKLAATLIKQFTHWLPSTNDPHHALARFRDLVARLQPGSAWPENMQSLQRPDVLHAVARVLGISQYLWEEFLQSRHQELFPLLANTDELQERICRDALALDLDAAVDQATDLSSAWRLLNRFKDRHLFRIELRHVLGHCRPFGAFSEELTELAELVVAKALELAERRLTAEHGQPKSEDGRTSCEWAVAGLGKFGGIEMGFASDLELMLVYEAAGQSDGRFPVRNSEFFDEMLSAVATGIVAPLDGMFHVDLRMRPFGQAGSGAVSLIDFEQYYGSTGPAWPYERQAMVKLRCIAGNSAFGARVTATCQRAIYSAGSFDFPSMRAMRERQVRQLVRGGAINAKLSDGGIVDCEYAVQAIQLTFGSHQLALRHPNTLRVLHEAARLGLITWQQRNDIERAYVFLRELIDCLRLVRGNAKDLTVPALDTRDWHQLDRRMRSIHDSDVPLEDLEQQMQLVREFSVSVELQCGTGRHE